jgi:predicted O-linked N-acetylglucosamine transferase (SPINDLY family)
MLRVDIGCGDSKPEGFIGVDIYAGPRVDIVADISKVLPFHDDRIDELRAHDVIEHLPDRINTMNEIWRVCRHGARVDIRVPSSDGRGAFQDPTHISFWNINSFLYYSVDHPEYINLCTKYGFKGAFKILRLEQEDSGSEVIHIRVELEVLKTSVPEDISNQALLVQQKSGTESFELSNSEIIILLDIIDIHNENLIFQKLLVILNVQELQDSFSKQTLDPAMISKLRSRLSQFILNSPVQRLQEFFSQTKFLNLYQFIVLRSTYWDLLSDDEPRNSRAIHTVNQAQETSEPYSEDLERSLLIAMLYSRPYIIGKILKLDKLSEYIRWNYFEYCLASPTLFSSLGESERYAIFLRDLIDYLYQEIFNNLESLFWKKVTEFFFTHSNLIHLYFNELNVRDVFMKRAKILELHLKDTGSVINYTFSNRDKFRKKIRLGILATHFLPSAETYASLPVYEYLSRDFEVILYTIILKNSNLTSYCRSCVSDIKILPSDLEQQVQVIREDDLDIIFIATNVTVLANVICQLAIHRLARVQIASVASVVTTGMTNVDYFISGNLTDSEFDAEHHYSEKLIRLRSTAQCFSYPFASDRALPKISRDGLGVKKQSIVYASAANFYKLIPELLHCWAKIIAAVPQSVLLLFPYGPNWSQHYPKSKFESLLKNIFLQYNLSIDRLMILDPKPTPDRELLQEYLKIADVYLDSYPFAGTTSLMEPLAVGLPIVTRRGRNFRSAMGSAILNVLELDTLVGTSEQEYCQIAINLGKNSQLRLEMQNVIRKSMSSNPSFLDSRRYSHELGKVFLALMNTYNEQKVIESYKLRQTNFILFPDWQQSQETLFEIFKPVLRSAVMHPERKNMTLLIYCHDFELEEVNELFVSSVMQLLLEEDIEFSEDGPEVTFIPALQRFEWQELVAHITARIPLSNEYSEIILDELVVRELPILEL